MVGEVEEEAQRKLLAAVGLKEGLEAGGPEAGAPEAEILVEDLPDLVSVVAELVESKCGHRYLRPNLRLLATRVLQKSPYILEQCRDSEVSRLADSPCQGSKRWPR